MATLEFKSAVGRIYFDGGLTDDGKLIRKSKSYRNVAENIGADSLYNALEQLAQLSALPLIDAEKVATSKVIN